MKADRRVYAREQVDASIRIYNYDSDKSIYSNSEWFKKSTGLSKTQISNKKGHSCLVVEWKKL